MWYIDSWYIILVVPALIFMLITQIVVNSAISKYGQVRNARGVTGKEMAEAILSANGIYDVRIERLQTAATTTIPSQRRYAFHLRFLTGIP